MNFDIRSLPIRDFIIGGILVVVVGNLIYLDVRTTTKMLAPPVVPTNTVMSNPSISSAPIITAVPVTPPCASCPAQINMAMDLIQNIQKSLTVTPAPTTLPTPTSTPMPQPVASGSSIFVKDYYIPMGIGSGQAADFTDVSGVQATIDTSLYPPIKTTTLEFTGYTPTGNQVVYARLYDDTDAHAIASSDITWSGGDYQSFVTPPLTLDTGKKTYSIQLKTQLQFVSFIESARIHIVLY